MKLMLALGTAALALLLPVASTAQVAPISGGVTVIGCLMRAADYRALMKDNPAVVASLAQAGEYVLADAAPVTASGQRASGAGANGTRTYAVSGKLEAHLAGDVGKMVEVVGRVENAVPNAAPKLTISVWHASADPCPAK